MGCFSFDYYKVLVSGEGGFVTTDDEWLYTRAQSWHDCAACWRPDRFARERREGELFCGENYRMSELRGRGRLAQIRKTDAMLAGYRRAKRAIKAGHRAAARPDLPPMPTRRATRASALIVPAQAAETTRKAIAAMQAEGVPAGGIYDSKVRDWHVYTYWEHILEQEVRAPRRPAVERGAGARAAQVLARTCARGRSTCSSRGDHDRHRLALHGGGLPAIAAASTRCCGPC